MKRSLLFFLLGWALVGCGGGNSGSDVTITLAGTVTQGATSGGQGNPAPSAVVTINETHQSATITSANNGTYSIGSVPVGGTFTVQVTEPNNALINVSCGIRIPDSTTIQVTSSPDVCSAGTSPAIGTLILNITLP
ncbi:MAG: carboxypeptidase regulatory-like domain-containing protein [Nitrospirae bacterium]|nr:carboxypeptidase regulatory-like domain-containing protein [Candidatus Manganitrophaceae bacterium]